MIELKEPEQPKRTLIERINDYLKKNTNEDQEEVTMQDIATDLGIGLNDLYKWLKDDTEFREGLERLADLHEQGLFKAEEFGNRADAMILALALMEKKKSVHSHKRTE